MSLRTSLAVQPHLYIGDVTGKPLDYGIVFFGQPNKDPEFYPINIFYDEALTTPAAHPVRTKGGFMNANGQMVEVYALETEYSVKVLDTYGRQVFYQPVMSGENAELVAQKLDTGITATAKFGGSARLLSDKLSEIVSVKDFGAVGDGTVDDTAAIQKAIDSGVKCLYFPTGVYIVNNGSLQTTGGVHLFGDGKYLSILKSTPVVTNQTFPILREAIINGTLQKVSNLLIRNMSFEGNGSATNKVDGATSGLFRCYQSENLIFENVDFYNSRGYGAGLQGTPIATAADRKGKHLNSTFIGCDFYNNGKSEYFNTTNDPMDGIDIKSCEVATFIGCRAWGNGDKGFDVRSKTVIFNSCHSWGNASHGFELGSVINTIDLTEYSGMLSNCFSFNNGGSGVYLYGTPYSTTRAKFNISNIQAYGNRHGVSNPSTSGGISASDIDVTVVGGNIHNNEIAGVEMLGSSARYAVSDAIFIGNGVGINSPINQNKVCKVSDCTFQGNGRPFNVAGGIHFSDCVEEDNLAIGVSAGTNKFTNYTPKNAASTTATTSMRLPEYSDNIYIGGSGAVTNIQSTWDGRVVYLRVTASASISTSVGNLIGDFVPLSSEKSLLVLIYRQGTGWNELNRYVG